MTAQTIARVGGGKMPTRCSKDSRKRPPMRHAATTSRQVYLSVRNVAVRTDVAPRTVKRWIAAGILPATRLPSPKGLGQLRIRSVDLEVMLARGTQS
jgi:Helix-turn-helix domain